MSEQMSAPAFGTARSSVAILRSDGGLVQRAHAAAILVLPTLAAAVALWQVWHGAVRAWEPAFAVGFYALTMLGITVGFHRLLSHRAFQTSPALRGVLCALGAMAAQGPPIYWASNHRRHHAFVDDAGDPHSPHRDEARTLTGWAGFWHAHVGWTFSHGLSNPVYFCKDLVQDRVVMAAGAYYYAWVVAGLALAALVGAAVERSPQGAWDGLIWGGGVRLFISYHLTNSINSVTHLFGYRTFKTPEQSRNNLWLGVPTLGEAWHNNHHAFPSSAIFGFAWWEIDAGGIAVRGLERLGLIWNVRRPSALAMSRRRSGMEVPHE